MHRWAKRTVIPQDFVDQLLSRVDIIDVVGRYVPLKKGGQNYFACCPFHKEKSPSFTVSPIKQFYHCFGCGAHGSVLGFIMEYQGLSFVDAVRVLAEETGSEMPRAVSTELTTVSRVAHEQRQSLEQVVALAAKYYKQQLKFAPDAIHYLKERGVTGNSAAHFDLGYAPNGWQALATVFPDYNKNEHLVEGGLTIVHQDGRRYDRFRGRVMFPIRNQRGAIIGFGARALGEEEPKYLNSPETPLFEKSKELYGLYEARQAIREHNCVVVVEGYMDVVSLAQSGIDYAVATLGTATTAEHIRKLMRQVDTIYFCFDGDAAGQKAAWRALENSLTQLVDGKSLYFLFLPHEHDPDSFVRSHGGEAFQQMLERSSIPLSAYLIRELTRRVDMESPEGHADLIQQAVPLLAQIRAPALGLMIKKRLAELVSITLNDFDTFLGKNQRPRHGRRDYQLPAESNWQVSTPLVHKQIKWLLMNPAWAEDVQIPDSLALSADIACFAMLAERAQHYATAPTPAQMLECLRGTPFEESVNRILQRAMQDPEEFVRPDESCRAQFRDGNEKLLQTLRKVELERLKRKSQSERLTAEEAQLMRELLAR